LPDRFTSELAVPRRARSTLRIRAHIPEGWREFVSEKGGYIAYYPGSWHILGAKLPTLQIANFRFSQIVTAVVVPNHGAVISIAPPPPGVTAVDQWITGDRAVTPVMSEKSFTLQRPETNPALRVTEVVFEQIEGPGTVSWYFDLSGHLLVANLSYWEGDPNLCPAMRASGRRGSRTGGRRGRCCAGTNGRASEPYSGRA